MPKLKPPPIRVDWLALAAHDPSILTFRHCTGGDIRRLAPLAQMPLWRARRAFQYRLFYHPCYLTLSLDPAFEPQEPIRERAKMMLDLKLSIPPKKATDSATTVPIQPTPTTTHRSANSKPKPSRLSRFDFSDTVKR